MNKNQKVGLTSLNWLLSIGGIVILSLFIILPPVFRVVFAEEEVIINEQEPPIEEDSDITNKDDIDDSTYLKTTCTRNTTFTDYVEDSTIILAHENNLLRILTINTNNNYHLSTKESESLFTDSKLACTSNMQSLVNIAGLNYGCNISENSVLESLKYDLTTFEVTTLPTDKIESFTPSYTFNQDVTVIANLLINDGYTCQ